MPFKQDVTGAVDHVEESARAINAVNTIVNEGGRLTRRTPITLRCSG